MNAVPPGQSVHPLPSNSGLAFILVQHLDPTRESMLSKLLSRVTPMLVQQVQDGMVVQPIQVYVAPPQSDVVISYQVVKLILHPGIRGLHMPLFHYALQPSGVLILGPAESIATFSDLFTLVDQQNKIAALAIMDRDTREDGWERGPGGARSR